MPFRLPPGGRNVKHAGVAELADAPDSKSGGRKAMRVRFSPSVRFTKHRKFQNEPHVFIPAARNTITLSRAVLSAG